MNEKGADPGGIATRVDHFVLCAAAVEVASERGLATAPAAARHNLGILFHDMVSGIADELPIDTEDRTEGGGQTIALPPRLASVSYLLQQFAFIICWLLRHYFITWGIKIINVT